MKIISEDTPSFPSGGHPASLSPVILEQGVVTSHSDHLHRIIRERTKIKRDRDKSQGQLLKEQDIFHEVIRSKLHPLLDSPQFDNFTRCGKESVWRTCKHCDDTTTFTYHCSIKWCPRCNWRITRTRQEILAEWTKHIKQPKHIVTTQRNTHTLTRSQLKKHSLNLARLRRHKVFSKVKGGCVSVEITNESRGWHMHAHWLVDARWIDAPELSKAWGKLVGQEYAIVHVSDLRQKDYLREVSKYVVKGSDMARWQPEEINEFVQAVRGRRFFFTFGSLFHCGKQIRALLALRKQETVCECGCSQFIYRSEEQQTQWATRPR
jgi:hypothetical protein